MKTKIPTCKICGGPHYKTFCFKAVRAPLKTKTVIRTRTTLKPVKRAVLAPQRKSERASLIVKLDRVFSLYIRLTYSTGGYVRCVTCGKLGHYKSMQNGHFISRRKMQLRWDEKNCHVQCKHCNEDLHGNLVKYKAYILAKYGASGLLYLQQKSNDTTKVTIYEIKERIRYYEKKVTELELSR